MFSYKDSKLYIGYCKDLNSRLKLHVLGKVYATRTRRPLRIIYYEAYLSKEDAKKRERFLKSGFGRSQLKKALKKTLEKYKYKYLKA